MLPRCLPVKPPIHPAGGLHAPDWLHSREADSKQPSKCLGPHREQTQSQPTV